MSPGNLPCVKALDRECFRAHPEFARRALAYRLLHLLIPPDIAKLLPKKLSDPLVAPGVEVPLGAVFPPGTVLVPGCSFPVGWDPEDEPPECAKSRPLPTLAMQIAGGNPSVILSPGEPGTGQVHPPPGPPPVTELWFDEPFDNITDHTWTVGESGSATVTIVTGRLRLYGPPPADLASINRTDSRSLPATIEVLVKNEIDGTVGKWAFVLSGPTYMLYLILWDDTTLRLKDPVGWTDIAIDPVDGENILWKFSINGDQLDIYRDGTSEVTAFTLPATLFADGWMWISSEDGYTTYTDYYTIEDLT